MIGASNIRKILNAELKDFLKSYGFNIGPILGNHGIIKREQEIIKIIEILQRSPDYIAIGHYPLIRFNQVSDIMFKITNLETYQVENPTIGITSDEKIRYALEEKSGKGSLQSVEEIKPLADLFKKHFVELYLPAFEKYSNPVNVLELFDKLNLGERSSMFNDPCYQMKIIILSKMINDSDYSKRCEEGLEFANFWLNQYTEEQKIEKPWKYKESLNILKWTEEVIDYLEKNEI
jgi:hypothetical protein